MKILQLVIATRNQGKLWEFRNLLSETGWQVLGLADVGIQEDCEENGSSFAENARLKALSCARHTDRPVLGDDSGLEVFALGGRPGIHSARYAGPMASDPDRIAKLLSELKGVPGPHSARFVCALALACKGSLLLEVEGACRGEIVDAPRGTHGFGYDPLFLFPELGRTYAELDLAQKNRSSHRAHAVRLLLEQLRACQ